MINLLLILQLLAISQCYAGKLTAEENRKRAADCGILEDGKVVQPFLYYMTTDRSRMQLFTIISPRHFFSDVKAIQMPFNETYCKEKNKDVTGILNIYDTKGTYIGSCDDPLNGLVIAEVHEDYTKNRSLLCLPTSPLPTGHSVHVMVRDGDYNFKSEESTIKNCDPVDPRKLCLEPTTSLPLGSVIAKTDDGRFSAIGSRITDASGFPDFWSLEAFKDEICAVSGVCLETTLSSASEPFDPSSTRPAPVPVVKPSSLLAPPEAASTAAPVPTSPATLAPGQPSPPTTTRPDAGAIGEYEEDDDLSPAVLKCDVNLICEQVFTSANSLGFLISLVIMLILTF